MDPTSGMERFCGSVSFHLARFPVYCQHFCNAAQGGSRHESWIMQAILMHP